MTLYHLIYTVNLFHNNKHSTKIIFILRFYKSYYDNYSKLVILFLKFFIVSHLKLFITIESTFLVSIK